MNYFGAESWTLEYIIGYIFLIFPIYQGLTLIYAAIFGKFNFFFSRQKKIVLKITGLFTKNRNNQYQKIGRL